MSDSQNRFWQIDAARGLAIIGMVLYHFLVDLKMIFHIPIGVYQSPLVLFARLVAITFILLVGMSAAIRYEKVKTSGVKEVIKTFTKRSLYILLWAGVVTVVTFIMFREETIVMGILHFIGLSTMLVLPFFLLENRFLVVIAILSFLLGIITPSINTTNYLLLPFGMVPKTFNSFDYFPLFPWFGVILIGVVLGRTFLKRQSVPATITPRQYIFLTKIGQKSLPIYLLHQPALWLVLTVLGLLLGS